MTSDQVQVVDRVGPEDRVAVDELLALAETTDGHRPFSAQIQLALDHASTGAHGDMALLVRAPDGTLAAFGFLARRRSSWDLELVVHPEHPGPQEVLSSRVLEEAIEEVRRAGGGPIRHWAFKPSADHDAAVRALGFVPERDLLQMRVPLPLPTEVRSKAPAISVRPFRTGTDEGPWLVANNRAFAHHPEQGGWDMATLIEREGEPWFDPAGFLLYEEGGRLAGSCWTKVHRDTAPPLGEIYVISVDPDFAGRGLGRGLTVAGLDHLVSQGLAVGMLYVDGANETAVGLYRSLGFTVDHVDRAYVTEAPTSRPMP